MDQRCEDIKEYNGNSASSVRLKNNLLEIHYNILENVKNKLAPLIENLLKAPYENTFYWWFCFFWIQYMRKTRGKSGNYMELKGCTEIL